MAMPEPDFRLAVETAARAALVTEKLAPRITEVCRARGAPWRFIADAGFQSVGDEVVERELLRPALAALNDPRFAGGVRSEFESARNELRAGTAVGRKQAVYECGCAIESAMKLVLDERGMRTTRATRPRSTSSTWSRAGWSRATWSAPCSRRRCRATRPPATAPARSPPGRRDRHLAKLLPPAPPRPSLFTRLTWSRR
jgi:hypothetical protein